MDREEIDKTCDLLEDKMHRIDCRSIDLLLEQKILLSLHNPWQWKFSDFFQAFAYVTQPTVRKVLSQSVDVMTANASNHYYLHACNDMLFFGN